MSLRGYRAERTWKSSFGDTPAARRLIDIKIDLTENSQQERFPSTTLCVACIASLC